MFLPNDVIEYRAGPRLVRILWIDPDCGTAWIFQLGEAHAMPQPCTVRQLADDVIKRNARLLQHDPCAAAPLAPGLPASHLELQARAWQIVSTLQASVPALYQPRMRASLIADRAQQFGVSRASVLRYLRRFWERGQTPEALLPDYGNSGAPGKPRAASAGVKRGRPRKSGEHPGLNIDEKERAVFQAAVARYQASHLVFSRRACYSRMLEEFYRGCDAGAVPSFGQFSYWLAKDPSLKASNIAGNNQNGAHRFAMVQRNNR